MKNFTLLFIFSLFSATLSNAKGHGGGHSGGHGHSGHHSSSRHSGGYHSFSAYSGGQGGYRLHWFNDDFLEYGMSVKYIPVNGYIVYNNDTLYGTVIINNISVSLIPSVSVENETGNKFFYTDKFLKSIVVAYYGQNLFLTRANEHDKTLSRVIHGGKLTIYDDRYSFPTPYNIDQAHLKIADGGEARSLTSFVTLDTRHSLVKSVNKVYGLNLHMTDYTFPDLYTYINNLD